MSITISYTFYTRGATYKSAMSSRLMLLIISYAFYTCITAYKKKRAPDRRSIQLLLISACTAPCTKKQGAT
jgi:hypothetical protein